MLEESAIVIDVHDGYLWVESQSRSACGQCSTSSCTTSVISKMFGVRANHLMLKNSLDVRPGQHVIIGIPDDLLVRASIWAYMVPLIFMVMGTVLGNILGLNDGLQSVLALSGLILGFYLVRGITQSVKSRKRFIPQLLRVADNDHLAIEIPINLRSKQ